VYNETKPFPVPDKQREEIGRLFAAGACNQEKVVCVVDSYRRRHIEQATYVSESAQSPTIIGGIRLTVLCDDPEVGESRNADEAQRQPA
jgi:hypothetical protein